MNIGQNIAIKGLYTQIYIQTSGFAKHLCNRLCYCTRTSLTTPYYTSLFHHIAYRCRTTFVPDKVIIHKADCTITFCMQRTHFFGNFLRRTIRNRRLAMIIFLVLYLTGKSKRTRHTINTLERTVARCNHRRIWSALEFRIAVGHIRYKMPCRKW